MDANHHARAARGVNAIGFQGSGREALPPDFYLWGEGFRKFYFRRAHGNPEVELQDSNYPSASSNFFPKFFIAEFMGIGTDCPSPQKDESNISAERFFNSSTSPA